MAALRRYRSSTDPATRQPGEIEMQFRGRSAVQFALFTIPLILTIGCSTHPQADYSKLGLVEVAGVISLDGQPMPQAAIFFYQDNGSYSYGITDQSGHYVAMFNSEKSGVIPGLKQIEISTVHSPVPGGLSGGQGADAADGEDTVAEEEDPDLPAKQRRKGEKIPACYNAQGILKVSIEKSDRGLDFDLKSDCSTTGPT